jgi:hypothetical protein
MNLAWTEEQQQFRHEVIEFAQSLTDDTTAREKNSTFSPELWSACADWGVAGVVVPKAYGGRERGDILSGTLAMEAMGYTSTHDSIRSGEIRLTTNTRKDRAIMVVQFKAHAEGSAFRINDRVDDLYRGFAHRAQA